MRVIPPPHLIKVASNTRPYSKPGGTTLNGREKGGQYYIIQTCDQERFEARKVVFPWECLIIFATGCSMGNRTMGFHLSRDDGVCFFYRNKERFISGLIFSPRLLLGTFSHLNRECQDPLLSVFLAISCTTCLSLSLSCSKI